MKDEHTNGKKMARNGRNTVIYKGTFVSNPSLGGVDRQVKPGVYELTLYFSALPGRIFVQLHAELKNLVFLLSKY